MNYTWLHWQIAQYERFVLVWGLAHCTELRSRAIALGQLSQERANVGFRPAFDILEIHARPVRLPIPRLP